MCVLGSKGCDTSVNGPECKLHYTLALAEHDGKTIGDITTNNSPVVLWLNGGPVSLLYSSLLESVYNCTIHNNDISSSNANFLF
jgi:hypothetical protein